MSFTPTRFRTLRTARMLLRIQSPDDLDAVHAYQSRADVCEYLLYEPRTREQVAEVLARRAGADRLAEDGDDLELAMDADGLGVIGHLYLKLDSVEHATAEIGWAMHPDHQGHGYATEGATALIDYAFGLGLHRVRAELDPRNASSVALCRRLGLREEAHFVEDMWFKGAWADTGVFAVLDREWAARPR